MAFSNFAYLNASSSGATRNSGTNGDGNGLFDWGLRSNSNWVRVFHDGTNFIDEYQPAAGGPILSIRHNSAVSGNAGLITVRLAESQSSGTLTDPVPQTGQVADASCTWMASNAASTTTRDFHMLVWETGLIYLSKYGGTTDQWELGYACKGVGRYAADTTYPWVIGVRNLTGVASIALINQTTSASPSNVAKNFFLRNIAATIKSEYAVAAGAGTSLGVVSNAAAIGSGYGGTIDRRKVTVTGNGSNTTTIGSQPVMDRIAIPQLWTPLHSSLAGIGENDTITDGSSTFLLLRNGNNGVLLQTSNDWSGYPGG